MPKCNICKNEVSECSNCGAEFMKFEEIVCAKKNHFCSASCYAENDELVYGEVE